MENVDELRHEVNAYEMVVNDDYLVNTYFGSQTISISNPAEHVGGALSYHLAGFPLAAVRLQRRGHLRCWRRARCGSSGGRAA